MLRKEEIERKKKKLAELRKLREYRQSSLLEAQTFHESLKNDNIDELVNSLIGDFNPNRYTQNVIINEESKTIADPVRFNPPVLSISEFVILDLAPVEIVSYSKEIQTDPNTEPIREPAIKESNLIQKSIVPIQQTIVINTPLEPSVTIEPIAIDSKQLDNILGSENFIDFIESSSKVIERALNDKYDYTIDYRNSNIKQTNLDQNDIIRHLHSYSDNRWTKDRPVTRTHWSMKYPELSLSSYGKPIKPNSDPDGIVLVWNLHLPNRPEFIFHSQSDVLVAKFTETHPNTIIGANYSGQVLIWDTRSKPQPVLKSPLSSNGHTHPIYDIQVVGTQSSYNILSVSTDGVMCSWQMDMLAQPVEIIELTHASHPKTDECAVTCFGFPINESSSFYVGTEEGSVYHANRFDRASSKSGLNPLDVYKGHDAMITGLDFHKYSGVLDFSDLFLTCSLDWTCRLWRTQSINSPKHKSVEPLFVFESDEPVYDVKWCPTHPAVFVTVDAIGNLNVYNLNQDIEYPISSIKVGESRALNSVSWDKEGKKVCVGSIDGSILVYEIHLPTATLDDSNLFRKVIGETVQFI